MEAPRELSVPERGSLSVAQARTGFESLAKEALVKSGASLSPIWGQGGSACRPLWGGAEAEA